MMNYRKIENEYRVIGDRLYQQSLSGIGFQPVKVHKAQVG